MDSESTRLNELEELNFRRELCQTIIKLLKDMDDPRRDAALKEYQAQLKTIEDKIAAREAPPPVVVPLKSATLSGQVPAECTRQKEGQ